MELDFIFCMYCFGIGFGIVTRLGDSGFEFRRG